MYCSSCGTQNEDNAKFCGQCGSQLKKAENFDMVEKEPKIRLEPENKQNNKQNNKRIIIIFSVLGGLLIILAGFYFVGSNMFSPENVAEKYIQSIVDEDWEKTYTYLDVQSSSPFITEESFMELFSDLDSEILDYSIEKVSDGSNKVYTVKVTQNDQSEYEFTLVLNPQKAKKFLFFDTYKASLDDYATDEYTVYVPIDTILEIDGKKVEQKYLTESNPDYDLYSLPYIFYGEHNILVTRNGYDNYECTVYIYGQDSYRVYPSDLENAFEDNLAPVSKDVDTNEASDYTVVKSDDSWEIANSEAKALGGNLVAISNASEFLKICDMAYNADLRVFWLGAKRNNSQTWDEVSWQNGKAINFTNWLNNEPSYVAEDGNSENYLICFYVDGNWYYNDSFNNVSQYYSGKMGYIVEFEGASY